MLIITGFSTLISPSLGIAQGITMGESTQFPYTNNQVINDLNTTPTENVGDMFGQGTIGSDETILSGLIGIFGFGGPEYEGVPKALIYVRVITNMLLGLTSFIALAILIYSFYQMFFTEDSKGIEQVKKNLTGVAIAIAILGVSRFATSLIFRFYESNLLNAT
jgi:hypothetical protein